MLLARRLPRFYRRLDHLSEVIAGIDGTVDRTPQEILAAERSLIQFQIEWEHFVRDLILDSATGRFANGSGPVRSRSFADLRSREVAAHKLITLFPKSKFEPDWYLPDKAIDAAVRLDLSNRAQISLELGVTPWPIDELRHLRNFISHRSKRAALKVREAGIVGTSREIDVLAVAFQYGSSGVKRYIEWIKFSKGAAKRLVA
jgi:hypothetical protein